ncbi:hypothetical protein H5410_056438 [Solanum commersonii]|uniref:Uncharacterized protein n=1 Tax=Solanum commersonii TaxID=4109 RepID=A0A9J5WMP6_SOLCO|nr:hypothetical protein H5410_056438 [Solanum commersonii]
MAKSGVYLLWESFDLENGSVCPSRSTGSITKVLTNGVHLLRGSFNDENGPVYPSGPTDSIAKVLTDVQEKFQQKRG